MLALGEPNRKPHCSLHRPNYRTQGKLDEGEDELWVTWGEVDNPKNSVCLGGDAFINLASDPRTIL